MEIDFLHINQSVQSIMFYNKTTLFYQIINYEHVLVNDVLIQWNLKFPIVPTNLHTCWCAQSTAYPKTKAVFINLGNQFLINFSFNCHQICIKHYSSTTLRFCFSILFEIEIYKTANLSLKLSTIISYRLQWNYK